MDKNYLKLKSIERPISGKFTISHYYQKIAQNKKQRRTPMKRTLIQRFSAKRHKAKGNTLPRDSHLDILRRADKK
jgi:hypothetical protein